MKREELEKILGEAATKELVDSLLNAFHAEIKTGKETAEKAQADLRQQLAQLQETYEKDVGKAREELDNLRFDTMLNAVIVAAKARNGKAVRALLDMDALRASTNPGEDIEMAVKALAEQEDSAFLFGSPEPKPTGRIVDVGGKGSGEGGGAGALNPWAKETWNMQKQAMIYKADPAKAKALANEAGMAII